MTAAAELDDDVGEPPASSEPWKQNKRGRDYVAAPHRHGIVYRVGDETIEQALARDVAQNPPDQKPSRKKRAAPKKAPPPRNVDLRELEPILAEALRAPAMPCALIGDEWAANHFTIQAPVLARQLVVSAEHNPWLRAKLEAATSGEEFALKLMSISTVTVAAAGYMIPPLIWWLNLAVSDSTRAMFNIPPRRPPKHRPPPRPAPVTPDQNGTNAGSPPPPVAAAA